MKSWLGSVPSCVGLTLVVYVLALRLYERTRLSILHPALTAVALIAVVLRVSGIAITQYLAQTQSISFWLGPSVVAFGVSVHAQRDRVLRSSAAISLSLAVGSLVGIISVVMLARWMGADRAVVLSLAAKSTTTPIAMQITERLGGIPALSAAVVIPIGVIGAVVGPTLLRWIRVTHPASVGLALGASAHGVGTARSHELGEVQGAMSAIALTLMGVATGLIAPWLVPYLMRL